MMLQIDVMSAAFLTFTTVLQLDAYLGGVKDLGTTKQLRRFEDDIWRVAFYLNNITSCVWKYFTPIWRRVEWL